MELHVSRSVEGSGAKAGAGAWSSTFLDPVKGLEQEQDHEQEQQVTRPVDQAGAWDRVHQVLGAVEPVLPDRGRLPPHNLHPDVVKLPEAGVLEEVGAAVGVLEGGVDVVGDPPPHGHIPGVVQLHRRHLAVEPPVHVLYTTKKR